ncbi:MAG: sigma-70 family RNA polymerase sigma factor [Alistipes sp.]|nr:sigma-70 family RNA polymerase sigma factor [Candidatus Minthomonas equi]
MAEQNYNTENELVRACLSNDRKAQRLLYDKYASRMYSVCRRYIGDRDAAADVFQDGFVTVFGKLGSYNGEGSLEGWMRKVFVNQALMQLRKNDVLKNADDISEMKMNVPFQDDVLDRLHSADLMNLISSMPTGFRTVFNLRVVEGFSHQEIAQKLGIAEGASRSQLSRARVWLKEHLLNFEKERK